MRRSRPDLRKTPDGLVEAQRGIAESPDTLVRSSRCRLNNRERRAQRNAFISRAQHLRSRIVCKAEAWGQVRCTEPKKVATEEIMISLPKSWKTAYVSHMYRHPPLARRADRRLSLESGCTLSYRHRANPRDPPKWHWIHR